jgi:hypothetical protein
VLAAPSLQSCPSFAPVVTSLPTSLMMMFPCSCLQVSTKDMMAKLRYPSTNEEETVSLDELIQDKCIAVGECQR